MNKKPILFSSLFYIAYSLFSFAGYFFINQYPISIYGIACFSIALLSLLIFIRIGESVKFKTKRVVIKNVKIYCVGLYCATSISICISWYLNIKHFGIYDIIYKSYTIRENVIGGNSVIPSYLGYINALSHALLCFVTVMAFKSKDKIYKILTFMTLLNILLIDLISFGRIGIVFGSMVIICSIIHYNFNVIFKPKVIVFLVLLLVIINIPRIMRGGGDNFDSTVSKYEQSLSVNVPKYLNMPLSVYFYYFTSPVAFSSYIDNKKIENTYGYRFFTPIYNIYYKISNQDRPNTIDYPIYVPYETNIYSILKDILTDFGPLGLFIIPAFFGYIMGRISVFDGHGDNAIYIFMMAIIMFSPLYNPMSFGMFSISFIFLFFINTFLEFE